MNTEEIISHVRTLRLPESGVEYIRKGLEAPSRLVGRSRYLSVASRFASQKLGEVVQAESYTSELPFLHAQELDSDVVAYLDQPPALFVELRDKRGRRHRTPKTPDFLVIRKQCALLYECKTRNMLRRLIVDEPANWALDNGDYRYLPAEHPAAALGMAFRIHDAGTIGPIHAANLRMLVNTKRSGVPALEERLLSKAIRLLEQRNGLPALKLAAELKLDSVAPIFATLLSGHLHFLLKWHLLSRPESTTLYATESHCRSAECALEAMAEMDCLREANFQSPLAYSPKAFAEAVKRVSRIKRIQSGDLKPTRSDYRHLHRLKLNEGTNELSLSALVPAYRDRGPRKFLPPEVEQLIAEQIHANYARPERWSVTALHRSVVLQLHARGLSPVVYETVRQRVNGLSRAGLALKREGYRAANAVKAPVPINERAIRAGVAWECAHVDATVLDEKVWLACALSKVLERPTIYLLIDECTSYILAFWICFWNAGDQAVACLLRDCIRRHEKLPCAIMHDQGSEYFSGYTESFSAWTCVDLMRRPSGAPRYGAHVEAGFKRINDLVIHQLSGNTQNDRLGRSSTAETRSAAHARHDLFEFLQILEDSLIEYLNNRPIGDEVATPREKFELSQRQFAGIARSVKVTPELLAHTAIPSKSGTHRRIDHAHGIRYMHRRYVGPGIKGPSLHGCKVPIRWEPYNPYVIYAQVKNAWVRLTCQGYAEIENVSPAHRAVELYLRPGTRKMARLAREQADRQMAFVLHQQLVQKAPDPAKAQPPLEAPSTSNLFAEARLLRLDLHAEESLS